MDVFILGLLGVWRITHLLHAEDGPGEVFVKLRKLAGDSLIGQAMDCFYCLSLWVAAPFALLIGQSWLERALLWPALSAGAIALGLALQRLKPTARPVVRYAEDEPQPQPQSKQEESHVQLWEITPNRDDNRDDADWDVARGEPSSPTVRAQVCAGEGARNGV